MNLDDFLKNQSIDEVKKTLKMIKDKINARNERIKRYGTQLKGSKEAIKADKKQGGWTNQRTMKKVFSIPADVYFSNPEYWNYIIKSKKFHLHPEYQIKGEKFKNVIVK